MSAIAAMPRVISMEVSVSHEVILTLSTGQVLVIRETCRRITYAFLSLYSETLCVCLICQLQNGVKLAIYDALTARQIRDIALLAFTETVGNVNYISRGRLQREQLISGYKMYVQRQEDECFGLGQYLPSPLTDLPILPFVAEYINSNRVLTPGKYNSADEIKAEKEAKEAAVRGLLKLTPATKRKRRKRELSNLLF